MHIDGLPIQLKLAMRDASDVEQIVDQERRELNVALD